MEFFAQMCWEEVPQIAEASLSAGPWRMTEILQIRSNAFAFRGGCHLSSHKTFDAKLLACYTQQYTPDSSLRSPNLSELMAADRCLMENCTNSSMKELEPRRCAARSRINAGA